MKKGITRISIAVFICLSIGFLSSIATQSGIATWYVHLKKPIGTPPNWLFAPVWTCIYILMGVAAGIVWNRGFYHKLVKVALYHFGFQLLFNAAWSVLFFGLRNPLLGLIDIVVLFILLLFTFRWFNVVNKVAAYLLIPYIIWVLYATYLNFGIWNLN
ncbi:tryptophan-rich sensory protein [Aquimarina sp. ERC-38]|uniref:TspO/MBR family protein n=1 Tax=Aquimarina sp. ERC-38 TaxID=2949996 RepID=UPI002244FF2D|nr:TspO/MBR family protein [Aquimarina sp. ERC-38]UZO81504.1 tryptophan-rich sensory protein [Aquimarina sp. ERC-38]